MPLPEMPIASEGVTEAPAVATIAEATAPEELTPTATAGTTVPEAAPAAATAAPVVENPAEDVAAGR